MYLIITLCGARTYFRSDKSIDFVSGFIDKPSEDIQASLEEYPIFQVFVNGATHTVVDVDKCDLVYSPECVTIRNRSDVEMTSGVDHNLN